MFYHLFIFPLSLFIFPHLNPLKNIQFNLCPLSLFPFYPKQLWHIYIYALLSVFANEW